MRIWRTATVPWPRRGCVLVNPRHPPMALSSLSVRREHRLPADTETKPNVLRRPYAISNWLVRERSPLTQRTARSDRGRRGAALARVCSVFLRKMVIGDRNDPSTRLLDDSVVRTFGIGFDRLRRIPAERRTIEVRMSFQGGMIEAKKLDEATGRPEATVSLPIAPPCIANCRRVASAWRCWVDRAADRGSALDDGPGGIVRFGG